MAGGKVDSLAGSCLGEGWVCLAVGVSGTRLHLVVVDNKNITLLVCNNQFKSSNTHEYNLPESYEV